MLNAQKRSVDSWGPRHVTMRGNHRKGEPMRITEFAVETGPPGGTILIEVDAPQAAGMQPAGRMDDAVVKAQASFEKALAMLGPTATALHKAVAEMAPDEIYVELGLKLTSEGGLVVVKGKGEANFTVRLTWKK